MSLPTPPDEATTPRCGVTGGSVGVRVASLAALEAASQDRLFVTIWAWKIHRVDQACADWRVYLTPETFRGMGDPGMTLYTAAEADALVRAGRNVFCRNCHRASGPAWAGEAQ